MSIVTLASGGLDSTVVALLAQRENIVQYPLFVDYGQRAAAKEWAACLNAHDVHRLPRPTRMELGGFGKLIRSGLTDPSLDILHDAFLPNRNLLFLLAGSAFAVQKGASAVSIGLLNEATHLFPDQTSLFLTRAEEFLSLSVGRKIRVLAPLATFFKADVIRLAEELEIKNTYSCHSGNETPCGSCISCREFLDAVERKEN